MDTKQCDERTRSCAGEANSGLASLALKQPQTEALHVQTIYHCRCWSVGPADDGHAFWKFVESD